MCHMSDMRASDSFTFLFFFIICIRFASFCNVLQCLRVEKRDFGAHWRENDLVHWCVDDVFIKTIILIMQIFEVTFEKHDVSTSCVTVMWSRQGHLSAAMHRTFHGVHHCSKRASRA